MSKKRKAKDVDPKKLYIRKRIKSYLKACREGNTQYNFSNLKKLRKQWAFEYEMERDK